MERAFAIGILLICEGSCFFSGLGEPGDGIAWNGGFWLELVEATDDFEASGEVLVFGL